MESYYVTGASGYIGSYLLNFLKKKKIKFKGFSRKVNHAGCEYVNDYKDIPYKDNTIIIHLAQSSYINDVNSISEIETLKYLLEKNWKHFIFISSAYLYGDNSCKLKKEGDDLDLSNLYSFNKHECEKSVLKKGGTVLRFTNVYGNVPKENTLISDILKKTSLSEKIIIKEAELKRDFLWIDDAIDSIYKSCQLRPNTIINIGTGKPTSIYELYNLFLKNLFEKNEKKLLIESSQKDSCLVVDNSKAMDILRWSPKTSISGGIKNIIHEMKL